MQHGGKVSNHDPFQPGEGFFIECKIPKVPFTSGPVISSLKLDDVVKEACSMDHGTKGSIGQHSLIEGI